MRFLLVLCLLCPDTLWAQGFNPYQPGYNPYQGTAGPGGWYGTTGQREPEPGNLRLVEIPPRELPNG